MDDHSRSDKPRQAGIRFVAQWLLPPLAVAVALLMTDWGTLQAVRLVSALGGSGIAGGPPTLAERHGLTTDQQLILYGDKARKTGLTQQKAIWEKWPDNRNYLHNYVTHLLSSESELGPTPAERYAALAAEIAKLQPLDPGNARFDYILAGKLLDQAVEIKARQEKGTDGKAKTEYDISLKDRAKLDSAMAHLKAGLGKPEFRRYTRELSVERLAIMGEATSLLEEISQVAFLAGLLLPDLAHLRNLERTSVFYGELLAKEGRRQEADLFLNAYRRLVPQVNHDAFTLIDVLVVGAIAQHAADRVPRAYQALGDTVAAERALAEAAALAAPVKLWREKVQANKNTPATQSWNRDIRRHGGILAALLLPALGEKPNPDELAPSRQLEYVVAEGLALGAASGGVVFAMLVFALMAMRYRWARGTGTNAFMLLPAAGSLLRILGYGVILPLLLYYGITRWLPWGGRELSLLCGWPHFLAQCLALLSATAMATVALVDGAVRRRCQELLLPVAPPTRTFWCIAWSTVGVLVGLALLPPAWLDAERGATQALCAIVAGLLLLLLLADIIYGAVCDRRYGNTCAAYYGSLARTLVPVAALALILVTVCARPLLRFEERRLIAQDTVMCIDRTGGGFTMVESRLTARLRAEIEKAVGTLPPDRVAGASSSDAEPRKP